MVYCIGHSILSPLGIGSQANYDAVQAGRSGLKIYSDRFADVEPFCASLFDTPQEFVPLCIQSVEEAVSRQLSAFSLQDKETYRICLVIQQQGATRRVPSCYSYSQHLPPSPQAHRLRNLSRKYHNRHH